MTFVPEFVSKNLNLTAILKPVEAELAQLEKKLEESFDENNQILLQISGHVLSAGGKRLRPAVVFLLAKALNRGFVPSNHFSLALGLELIHTATLVHDDVIDESDKRRNLKTVNTVWGNKIAVIAGDYLLSKALMKLAVVKNNLVTQIFANIMGEICEGEIQQGLQKFQIITMDDYIDRIKKKTANLFIAGAESAVVLTVNVDNLLIKSVRDYALNFGIAFQIIDDILNFVADEQKTGKPKGTDLLNGIITAPVIFAIQEYSEKGDSTLKGLIENQFAGQTDFNDAVDFVFSSKGIEKAQKLAKSYADLAIKSLDSICESPYKETLIELCEFVVQREF